MNIVFSFATFVFLGTLIVGALPFWGRGQDALARPWLLQHITGLAAGFLICAALVVAIPEGFAMLEAALMSQNHHYDHHDHNGNESFGLPAFAIGGMAVLAGFLFLMMLEGFGFGHDLHEEHHDHAHDHGHSHVNHPAGKKAMLVVIGLSFHAMADGLVIGAALAYGELALSVQLALVIMMHKFPAAFSVSAYSLHERKNRRRSMLDLLSFAVATPVAMIAAYFFAGIIGKEITALIVLFSAGTFVYVATVDVLPDMHVAQRSKSILWQVFAGAVLMLAIVILAQQLGGHGH